MSIDREKLLSIGVVKRQMDAEQKTLDKDRAAYKRLRRDGMQPPRIDGCAHLEKEAVTTLEVQTGVVMANLSTKERRQMAERLAEVEFTPR
jgi:uncharacterized membrane protein